MFSRCLQKERTGKLTFQAGTAAAGRKTKHAAFQNFVALQNCATKMYTRVLCSDKCDGFVFWLLKRDFLCVLLTSVKLRQSYRDVLRWWFYFHTWQIFGWSTLLFSKLVGIVLNTQSSRLFAEPSPDESSFVPLGPPSDHYCLSSSQSRNGPEILMTNYNWLMLNEKGGLIHLGN